MKETKNTIVEAFTCNVRLLDDTETSVDVKKETLGQGLVDDVCKSLDILEKDYFGLRFVDNCKQRHWLDVKKEVSKQLRDIRQPYMFFFRVKFYPTDPTKLKEDLTRYQVYLQLKRDILHGRLLCPFNNITDLAAHIVQAEVGDYIEEEHGTTYITGIKLLPRHSDKLEEKIIEYHKTLHGYTPTESEKRFLNLARCQDLYGVDPHPCKDQEDLPLYLGLTPQGIQIIREARRVSGFAWEKVNKVSYDNKLFYIQMLTETIKTNYAFRLNDMPSCKHLWRCTVEHMSFYGNESVKTQAPRRSALSPRTLFRKNKYKFKGKTENDLLNEADLITRPKPADFERKSSLRLSVHMNCAKNSYSLPNLKEITQQCSNSVAVSATNIGGNMDEERSHDESSSHDETSTSNSPKSNSPKSKSTDYERHDALAEFVTTHFPEDTKSSENSLVLDDEISITSSQDLNIEAPSIPEINVDEIEHVVEEPSKTITKFNITISQRLMIALYKEPLLLCLLLVITVIPMAILLEMTGVNKF